MKKLEFSEKLIKLKAPVFACALAAVLLCSACDAGTSSAASGEAAEEVISSDDGEVQSVSETASASFSPADIPDYSGEPSTIVNGNVPYFTEDDITTEVFENYSDLDSLGRCGVAYANVCRELMPTEKRGDISEVHPTGWQSSRYDFVDGESLYNRCHLIAHELAGEDANEKNLITGTRYFNVDGMQPYENMVADYVYETDNHVLYRVTPIFDGDNLVADGVLMEAYSVEDNGEGIDYCVFCYNVQPGVEIDYATGDNWLASDDGTPDDERTYILNTNSMKFHLPDCDGVADISEYNKQEYTGSRDDLIGQGYTPCGSCHP